MIGDRLQIGDVIIEISAPRTPCFKLATRMGNPAFIKDFVQAARTGAYARIIKTGEITAGGNIVLIKTTEDFPSVTDVFKTCHSKTPNMEIVQKALASPLGRYHKNIIQGIYDRNIS